MMHHFIRYGAVLVFASVVSGPLDAAKNQAEDSSIEEIVVTATKRATDLRAVSFSVDVLQGSALEADGAFGYEDFVRKVPGLDFSATVPGQNRLTMRGISSLDGASTVGIYLDEAPVTAAQEAQIDAVLYDLERVEVLRGPQGTLYGEGSMGGTIRFITNKPDPKQFDAKGSIGMSHTDHGGEDYSVNAVLNIPLSKDKVALRLVGSSRDESGFIDNTGLDKSDSNESSANSFRAALRSDGQTWLIDAFVLWNELATDGIPLLTDSSFTHHRPLSEFSNDEYVVYGLSLARRIGDGNLSYNITYFDRELETLAYLSAFGGLGNEFLSDTESLAQELRYVSDYGGPLQWLIGVFHKDSDSVLDNPIQILVGPDTLGPAIATGRNETNNEQIALFGEVSYDLSERLNLTLGLRYYNEDNKAETFVSAPALGIPPLSSELSQDLDVVTPKLGLTFNINDRHTSYVNIAQGFRAGGINANPLAPPGSPTSYDEDSVWNYEFGFKGASSNGRISGQVSVFYVDYSDYQANIAPSIIGGGVIQNVGDAHSQGIEATLTWSLSESLEVALGGNWVEAEIDTDVPGFGAPTDGNRLPLVPEKTFSLAVEYRFNLTESWDATIDADLSYVDESFETVGNFVQNDSYSLVNIRFGVQSERYGATLFVDNATNEKVSFRNLGPGLGYFTNRPRVVGLQLHAKH